jgi:hypothetical protein
MVDHRAHAIQQRGESAVPLSIRRQRQELRGRQLRVLAPDGSGSPLQSARYAEYNINPPVTPKGTRAGHSLEVSLDAGVPLNFLRSLTHDVDIQKTGRSQAIVKALSPRSRST